MIKFNDDNYIKFSYMGRFTGSAGWIHPEIAVPTHELILVTDGEVFIEEDGARYALKKGDLICLAPEKVHKGYLPSQNVSFFWLHFFCGNYDSIAPKVSSINRRDAESLFKQLNHLSIINADKTLVECKLLAFLMELKTAPAQKNKLFSDACEYVRVNAASAPTVKEIAQHFGYSTDYLSKVFALNAGIPLKKYIDRERLALITNLLLTTYMTIKEIAYAAGFEDDNALMKFFKYNQGCSPSQYRNSYYASHTNIS